MSVRFPHTHEDMAQGSDRWRITVERGPLGGVRRFTVWLHDKGYYNGGRPAWYACSPDVHALDLACEPGTANLMLDLLDANMLEASRATECLAVDLLHRNGIEVPAGTIARLS